MTKKQNPLENPEAEPGQDDAEFPFVQIARPDVGTMWDVVRRIGSAIIGGDFSGNARGAGSIDIQVERSNPTNVASGDQAIIFGTHCRASAARAMAFGAYAATDLPDTCNLAGLIVLKANNDNPLAYLCERGAAEIILATDVVDLTTIGKYDLELPSSPGHTCAFFVSECIVIVTHLPPRMLSAPNVQFGSIADPDSLVPPSECSHIFHAGRYERFAITWNEGMTSLSGCVTNPATLQEGDVLKGRFLFKGILVEDEQDGI